MIMDNKQKIKISSFKTGRLNNIIKQNLIFQWLKQNHTGIIFIQESHSYKGCETQWEREFGCKMFFLNGSSYSRGVCTIISNDLDYSVNECASDENVRFILLDLTLGSTNLILLNVYATTKDKLQEQNNFLKTILDL